MGVILSTAYILYQNRSFQSLWIHPAPLDKETNKDRLETKTLSVIFPRAAESVKDQRFCDSGESGNALESNQWWKQFLWGL